MMMSTSPIDEPDLGAISEAAERHAREWMETADPKEGVGSRHHTVPKFHLRRFASRSEQLYVRDRATGAGGLRNIKDLAIKDFYSFINEDGELDGRLEQILSVVEAGAARLIEGLLNPFVPPQPLGPEDMYTLSQFLSFQLVRGTRRRREIELLADWHVKTLKGHKLDPEALRDIRVVPHPNEHLKQLAQMPPELGFVIFDRPAMLVVLDKPLLITCDEPVVVNAGDDYVKHHRDCSLTRAQLERRLKKRKKNARGPFRQVVHVYPTRPTGLAVAEEIAFPLSPRTLLLLGPRGADAAKPLLRLSGDEASELAAEINGRLVEKAYEWVAASPDHLSIRTMELPPPGPILAVCDGGSVMSDQMKEAPTPRRPVRIRKEWR